MQHFSSEKYYNIKSAIISEIASKFDCKLGVLSLIKVGENSRRRADFKISVYKGKVNLGFYKHKAHDVVDIDKCLTLDEGISALIIPLKKFISGFKKPSQIQSVSVVKMEQGFDVIFKATKTLKINVENVISFAQSNSINRFYIEYDDKKFTRVYDNSTSRVSVDGVDIEVPMATFLQATEIGQEAIISFIAANITEGQRGVDLYSGCGTYSIPLLEKGFSVSSYEGVEEMVFSQINNIRSLGYQNLRVAEVRDLFKNPLKGAELNNFDVAVINPPRAGAERQIEQIASSNLNKVIYISCDRKTFERDLNILTKSGFSLSKIQGIDQFYWSKHIEIAALIER